MPRPTIGNLNSNPRRPTFLKAWRKHRGYSLERAGEEIGVDHSTLSKMERGKIPYNQQLLEKAAEVYGCEPSDLLRFDPSLPRDVDVFDMYERAPPQTQRIIKSILRTGTDE